MSLYHSVVGTVDVGLIDAFESSVTYTTTLTKHVQVQMQHQTVRQTPHRTDTVTKIFAASRG